METRQPTWLQTFIICACAAAFCTLGYLMSRLREDWGTIAWIILALLVLTGIGFLLSVFFLYLRPQYVTRPFAVFALLLLGHVVLVAILLRMGITR
jgi:hypothetical protein